jgi:hypothetical protein
MSHERAGAWVTHEYFTTPERDHVWVEHHPDVTGVVLDQAQALAYSAEFGPLQLRSDQGCRRLIGRHRVSCTAKWRSLQV